MTITAPRTPSPKAPEPPRSCALRPIAERRRLLRQMIPLMLPGTPRLSCAITLRPQVTVESGTGVCSDGFAAAVESLTWRLREGPAPEAMHAGVAVHAADLSLDTERWPMFVVLAREHGLGGVHSEPLRRGRRVLGTVSWYSHDPDVFDADTRTHFAGCAHAASTAVAATLALAPDSDAGAEADVYGGQPVLKDPGAEDDERGVIARAVAVLQIEHDCEAEAAFAVLRRRAQEAGMRWDVAAAVILDRALRTQPA